MGLSVMAMKCQGWVFLEDCARRPAFRMARMVASGRGSGVNLRTARLRRMAVGDVHSISPIQCTHLIPI